MSYLDFIYTYAYIDICWWQRMCTSSIEWMLALPPPPSLPLLSMLIVAPLSFFHMCVSFVILQICVRTHFNFHIFNDTPVIWPMDDCMQSITFILHLKCIYLACKQRRWNVDLFDPILWSNLFSWVAHFPIGGPVAVRPISTATIKHISTIQYSTLNRWHCWKPMFTCCWKSFNQNSPWAIKIDVELIKSIFSVKVDCWIVSESSTPDCHCYSDCIGEWNSNEFRYRIHCAVCICNASHIWIWGMCWLFFFFALSQMYIYAVLAFKSSSNFLDSKNINTTHLHLHNTFARSHTAIQCCQSTDSCSRWWWWFLFETSEDADIHFVSFDLVSNVIILWKIVFTEWHHSAQCTHSINMHSTWTKNGEIATKTENQTDDDSTQLNWTKSKLKYVQLLHTNTNEWI